jgi:hypothetical protein
MSYRVAIPSYKRAPRLRDSTLPLLQRHHIDPALIDVFVADEEEKAIYTATLDPWTYGSLIVAVPGIRAVRNFIADYYDDGQHLFCIDDDIRDIISLNDFDLKTFIETGFAECHKRNLNIFGIYPVANKFFMRDNITTDLRYIIACFYGMINRRIHVTLDDKEDYERTILYYLRDGGVIRFNSIAPITRYYKEPGGMQVTRTKERIHASAVALAERWPHLCRLNLKKKSGFSEVRLLRNPKLPAAAMDEATETSVEAL